MNIGVKFLIETEILNKEMETFSQRTLFLLSFPTNAVYHYYKENSNIWEMHFKIPLQADFNE